MAIVAFIRGVNVGAHRRFRPSLVAKALARYDVVNVGATGLLVGRKAKSVASFRRDLLAAMPFEVEVALCDGRELLDTVASGPFDGHPMEPDFVPFVSIGVQPFGDALNRLPIQFPAEGEWYVRIFGRKGQFLFGVYRRHMKTIGYLGRIDAALKTRVTTRKWSTLLSAARALQTKA